MDGSGGGSLADSLVKNMPGNTGDVSSFPEPGKTPWRRAWHPLQYSCLENPMDREAWRATVCGVTPSQTQAKGLSTHRHMSVYVGEST